MEREMSKSDSRADRRFVRLLNKIAKRGRTTWRAKMRADKKLIQSFLSNSR